jgi:hypothetical protein
VHGTASNAGVKRLSKAAQALRLCQQPLTAIKIAVVLVLVVTIMAKLFGISMTTRKLFTIPMLVLHVVRGKWTHILSVRRMVQSLVGAHRNGALWIHVNATLQSRHQQL